MKEIIFATTNKGKLAEAREILGFDVMGSGLPIDEIQSLDPVEVATKKALSYFRELGKPILVEDVSLSFEVMGKLPGTYINDFSKELGNRGLIDLLSGYSSRKATAQTTLVYCDKDGNPHVFIGIMEGKISSEEMGENGFGWDPIFIPDGSGKTLAQMDMNEKNKYSMRVKALLQFRDWMSRRR
jgi:non-canonical purine NTP pyrophosphatase (RdgB/HAM1 family)